MLGVERLRHVLYRICVPALLLAGLMLPEAEGAVAIEPQLSRTGQVHGGPTTNKRKAADVEWNEETEPARKCASISCIDDIAPDLADSAPDLASASKGKGAGLVHNGGPHNDVNRGSFDDRMHPRNRYFRRKPDFKALAAKFTDFAAATTTDTSGRVHVDWKNPNCSIALTRALLSSDYGLRWDLPQGFLCPPVPQRVNYVHWIEDLLAGTIETVIRPAQAVRIPDVATGLDIGVGASAIYPLLALSLHPKWKMIGTDINEEALRSARGNVERNGLQASISLQLVSSDSVLLQTVQMHNGKIDFCMCNPPFFAAEEDARKASHYRSCDAKVQELVTQGGERAFISRMIADSFVLQDRVRWYTTMVGHKSSLAAAMAEIKARGASAVRSTTFFQGKTIRWAVAWSFEAAEPRSSSLRFTACATPGQLKERLDAAVKKYGGMTLEWPPELSQAGADAGARGGRAAASPDDDAGGEDGLHAPMSIAGGIGHAAGGEAAAGASCVAPASYVAGMSWSKWPVTHRTVARGTVLQETWTRRARRAKERQDVSDVGGLRPLLDFVFVIVQVGLQAQGHGQACEGSDEEEEAEEQEWVATVMLDRESRVSAPVPEDTARLFDSLASVLLREVSCD